MRQRKVAVVVGTRPEGIKMAPICARTLQAGLGLYYFGQLETHFGEITAVKTETNTTGVPKLLIELIEGSRERTIDSESYAFLSKNAMLTAAIMRVLRGELRADGTERDILFENQIRNALSRSLGPLAARGDHEDIGKLIEAFARSHPDAASVIREALDHYSEEIYY